MPCEKEEFNASYLGEYELYRGYNTQSKEEINKKIIEQNYEIMSLFNDLIKKELNISLSEFGFNID
jgi:hypothetical protein